MIALLSNYRSEAVDPRDPSWLGNQSPNEKIAESGLWNVDHVEEDYDPEFLDMLESHIENTSPV